MIRKLAKWSAYVLVAWFLCGAIALGSNLGLILATPEPKDIPKQGKIKYKCLDEHCMQIRRIAV